MGICQDNQVFYIFLLNYQLDNGVYVYLQQLHMQYLSCQLTFFNFIVKDRKIYTKAKYYEAKFCVLQKVHPNGASSSCIYGMVPRIPLLVASI